MPYHGNLTLLCYLKGKNITWYTRDERIIDFVLSNNKLSLRNVINDEHYTCKAHYGQEIAQQIYFVYIESMC